MVTTILYRYTGNIGFIYVGVLEKKIETTILYRYRSNIGFIYLGIMEKKMETTALGYKIRNYSSFHFLFHYPHIAPK